MSFAAATVPGDAAVPNEDWFVATPDLIVVLDGATVRTETGCSHGAAWYAQQLGTAITTRCSTTGPLRAVLAASIQHVASLHPECDLTHPGTPSAAVGIVQTRGDRLQYLVLGDITIVLDLPYDERPLVISDPRVSATALAHRYEANRFPIGSPPKAIALVRMKNAELAARNQRGGYWISAANPKAAEQAVVGDTPIKRVRQLAVLSDGAARYVDLFNLAGWDSVLRILADSGPWWFINRMVRAIEDADPLGMRYPRNKRSDDATAVYAAPNGPVPVETTLDDIELEIQEDAAGELIRRLEDPHLYGDGNLQRVLAERRLTSGHTD